MNLTNSELSFIPRGFYNQKVDFTMSIDSIYSFFVSTISFIGFILNTYCFFALLPKLKIKQTNIYKYLRVYSFNSSLICFINAIIFFFSFSSKYLFEHAFEYLTRFYQCKYFCVCLYIFGNFLDIFISLDRLSIYLNRKLDKLNQIKPYRKCIFLFIISILTNLPILLSVTAPIIQDQTTMSNNSIYLNFIQTNFIKAKFAIIISLAFIFIRDIITLILQISCVFSLLYYYKYSTIQFDKYYVVQTRSLTMDLSRIKKKNYRGRNLLLMSIYSLIVSMVMHAIFLSIVFTVAFLKDADLIQDMILILIFLIISKHFLNVLILFKFNSKYIKGILC
jgi:hypothetical protein